MSDFRRASFFIKKNTFSDWFKTMPPSHKLQKRPVRIFLAAMVASGLAGCSWAPGPYLGVTATTTIDETDRPYVYDASDASLIEDRADIFAITPSVVARQVQARQAQESALVKRRVTALTQPQPPYEYRVGSRDVLRITVWNHPELNNPASMSMEVPGRVVDNDGTFFYPYVGRVRAAGRTVQEIRDELAAKLGRVLVEPQVDVSVADYRSQRTFVLGQVVKPGPVPITDIPLTIAELISQAGGVQDSADLRRAVLLRNGKEQPVDLYALFYEGDLSQNFRVQSGDVLTIPENKYNKVFVMGDVGRPQSLPMRHGRMTLAEALSDSGGFDLSSANAGHLYVLREGEKQRPQIWHLDASSPDALVLADRFELQPRDIVYVDPAAIARWGRVLRNILPTAAFVRATAAQN